MKVNQSCFQQHLVSALPHSGDQDPMAQKHGPRLLQELCQFLAQISADGN